MKYHIQEHLYIPGQPNAKGSCYPTALACMLDLELHKVPYFHLCYWSEEEKKNLQNVFRSLCLQGRDVETVSDGPEKHNYYTALHEADCLWNNILEIWLAAQGYRIEKIKNIDQWLIDNPDQFYFASGLSPRGIQHITIYQNGKLHHDPHPSGHGLVSVGCYEYLRKI